MDYYCHHVFDIFSNIKIFTKETQGKTLQNTVDYFSSIQHLDITFMKYDAGKIVAKWAFHFRLGDRKKKFEGRQYLVCI
ncbi:MAG: hypothetical protein COB83_04120 [Gammaproteobacteria bacterium]|nr:MAG: hypothetical protein COB83_04120 [Gammaproteobacteria bacterium]